MTRHDLEGKELTAHDAVRQALKHQNLGPDTSVEQVREWIKWTFPTVELPEDLGPLVEQVRREEA